VLPALGDRPIGEIRRGEIIALLDTIKKDNGPHMAAILVIHGLVKQPLVFDLEALARYPKVTRIQFVECGGNSAPLFNKDPVAANVQAIHGLLSCAEWTGVRLSTLLEEVGIDPKAKWLLAEGADGPSMNRSIPLAKGPSTRRNARAVTARAARAAPAPC
jgi:DMSO/TMAO reductase YedYZ molybdopterin-dependent catalytic subunit